MTEKYKKQLEVLAEHLVTPERYGPVAVAPVVELVPAVPATLTLCEPPEHGWEYSPDGPAAA